jgi:hypothetical protein
MIKLKIEFQFLFNFLKKKMRFNYFSLKELSKLIFLNKEILFYLIN